MRPRFLLLSLLGILALLPLGTLHAYEMRMWTSSDGKTLEAELIKFDGEKVTIKNKDGNLFTFDKVKLSQADLNYLAEYATVKKNPFGDTAKMGRLQNPAKDAKIDKDTFKEGGEFKIPQATFEILETPHFKIMHTKRAKPEDLAELAERMWLDTSFFHSGFARKFIQRKKAIFLVDDESTYLAIGDWFAGLLEKNDNMDAANSVRQTWSRAAAGTVHLPASVADPQGVLPRARVFRTYRVTSEGGRPEKLRGVWIPFRVHCIASDLLNEEVGHVSGFGSDGWHALSTGYSYYKEIKLAKKSETSILSASSVDTKSTGGFSGSEKWPGELKKQIRKKSIEPSFELVFNLTGENSTPATNVLAYSFVYFLQSNPERVAGWSKLMERISTSNQVPEKEDMAKLLGFENVETMEKEWLAYIKSSKFK